MWEVAAGVAVMVGLFAVLLGGMLVMTRGDAEEVEPGDLVPSGARRPMARTVLVDAAPRPGVPAGRSTR